MQLIAATLGKFDLQPQVKQNRSFLLLSTESSEDNNIVFMRFFGFKLERLGSFTLLGTSLSVEPKAAGFLPFIGINLNKKTKNKKILKHFRYFVAVNCASQRFSFKSHVHLVICFGPFSWIICLLSYSSFRFRGEQHNPHAHTEMAAFKMKHWEVYS